MGPGATTLTVMPSGASSSAQGPRHAQHAGLGRRIHRARGQAERGARRQEHDPAEALCPHRRQRRLQELDRAAEVQVDQRIEVRQRNIRQERGPDHAGVVDQGADLEAPGQRLERLGGGRAIGQVDLDAVESRVRELRQAQRERHHLVVLAQQVFANRPPDTGAAAGHDRDLRRRRHVAVSTSASTRNGLPLPFSIFRGGQISTAPVGGNWSRLARHCRP